MAGVVNRRVWVILGLVVVCVGGLLYLNGRRPVPLVRVAKVSRTDIKSVIASNGKVEPVAPSTLRALFDGFVSRVVAVEGKSVRKGEMLLTLDDTQVRAQLEQAEPNRPPARGVSPQAPRGRRPSNSDDDLWEGENKQP